MPDRFWVGGTASWDGTAGTKWAATSGGTGGASVPTSADDVFFDANSTGTVTIATGNTGARSINCTGFTGTIAGSAAITVAGSITLNAIMGWTHTGAKTITGTGTLTTAGKTFGGITINAVGITVTLGDAINLGNNALSIINGTFNTADYNITAQSFDGGNPGTKTINCGSSTLTFTANSAGVRFFDARQITFNAGTSTIVLTGLLIFGGGSNNFYNLNWTSTSTGLRTFESSLADLTFNNLSFSAPSTPGVAEVILPTNITVNGTLSTTGTDGNERVFFRSNTYGVRRTLTVNGSTSLTDSDFRDIIVRGGAAPISGTRIGDRGQCSGITFDTPKTVYWVQLGSGNWSGNCWSDTVLGTANLNFFPLPQDTAVVGIGISTVLSVTIDTATSYLPTVDLSQKPGVNNLNVAFSAAVSCYGSWTNGTQTQISGTSTLTFEGQGTKTITSAGKTFSNDITINTYGGTVELADAINTGSRTLTVTNGTFDTKNFTVSVVTFNSNNNNVRTIKLGSSTINASINGGAIQIGGLNLILDAGTSQINVTGTGSFSGGGYTYNNVSFTSANGTRGLNDGNTFNNLTIAAPAATNNVVFNIAGNSTINGTLTISAGSSSIRRTSVFSNIIGTQRILTCNAVAALTDVDFRDIVFAGNCVSGGNLTGTRLGDCGGNSGITFPAPKTVYWNLTGSQNWSATGWATSSGGTPAVNNFPLAQDTAVFDDAGAAGTVTINVGYNIGTFDASARTTAMTLNTTSANAVIYGDWKFGTGVTSASSANQISFQGRGVQTITSNGVTFGFPLFLSLHPTGTVQLADALSLLSNRSLRLDLGGTFDAVSYNVTVGSFIQQGTTGFTNTLKMGSGLWTISGTGNCWLIGATFNFFKGTADILLSDTSTTARTFSGGSLSYNKLTIGGNTSTSTTTIDGNNQFTELASTKTVAHTINLGAGTTQTFGKWSVTGTAGNVVSLTGTAQIQLVGSSTSGIDYLNTGTTTVATGAASPGQFFAGANSTVGGSSGIIATAAPTPRTLYWVGGTGNWSSTARWSLSSGGAGGQPIPTTFDDVIFDSASNATAYTVTIDNASRCNSLTISGPASGNVTLAGTNSLICHGDVTLPATGLTRTYTGNFILSGSTTGKTFTTNGVTIAGNPIINGVGCGWTLGSALADGGAGSTWAVTNGAFDTGNYSVSVGSLSSSNSNSRTINLGSSTITLQSFPTGFTNSTNLTFNAGTSQITLTATSPVINGGSGQTFYNVSITSTISAAINGANTFNNLTIAGRASSGISTVSLAANQTINGTLTLAAGANATMRTFVQSNTIGTTRTLTCNAASATDVDFRDITIAGSAAPLSGTRLGNCGGNSNITFPAPKTVWWRQPTGQNWASSTAIFATTALGTPDVNNFPLAQDTVVFDTQPSSGQTTTINAAFNLGTIDMSARTSNTMTLATGSTTPTIYGNWINGTGTTLNGTGNITFAGRGTQTITSAGRAFTQPITVDSASGTVQLSDSFTSSNALTLNRGTVDAVTYNVTCGAFVSSSSNPRTLNMGSGLWTLTGTSTVMNAGTAASNMALIKGTADILLSDTSTTSRSFIGDGRSFNKLTIGGATGVSTLTITGNNTFTEIASTKTVAHTIALGSSIQRVGAFTVTGTAGNVVTITGNTSNLIYTSPGTVSGLDYLNVQGRVYGPNGEASGIWYGGDNSTNSGSLGWEFGTGSITYNVIISESATLADVIDGSVIFAVEITETSTLDDSVVGEKVIYVSAEEGTSLADVQEFVNLILVSITENLDSAEAQDALLVFNQAVVEALTSADSAAVTGILSAILVENTNVADSAVSQAVFNALRSEGLTINEINQVASVIFAALTEGLSIADTEDAVKAFLVSITENVVSADTESALRQLVGNIAENLNSAETQTTQTNFNAARVEPVVLADISQAQADFNSAVTEATSIADILDAIRVLVGDITENSEIADSQDRIAIFFRTDIEGLIAQDEAAAQANFNSNRLENLIVSDQEVGYGWFRIVDTQTPNWSLIGSSLWLNNNEDVVFWLNNNGATISWTTASGASIWTQINNQSGVVWVEINNSQGT